MVPLLQVHGRLLLWLALILGLQAGNVLAAEKRTSKAEATGQRAAPADIQRRVAPDSRQRQRVAPERVTRPSLQERAWDFGCAEDHYPSSRRLTRQIRLRMPIPANELLGVIPEPGVIHSDLDASKSGSLTQCSAWGGGHLCYNGHEGTDYSLGGAFLQMGMVRAVAAAPGKVIYTRENEFDRCHVTTNIEHLLDDDQKNNVVCPDPDNPEGNAIGRANRVSMCHADGTVTEYLHLMRDSIPRHVAVGSTLQCGQVVGTVGSSGKSSGPHLHFSVLVPASRAAHMGHANGQTKKIGGRDYVYLDPYHISARKSLWTDQEWNYAGNFNNSMTVPSLEHPNGHPTTLACPHLVPPHDGHPGPVAACLHPRHPSGDQVTIAGISQTVPCTHPAHENGHSTTVPCLHPPVPAHPNGHQGPSSPCTHFGFTQVTISAFTLPGPQCDSF